MAPAASTSRHSDDGECPVEEIVFSCTICQATVSEVYATKESNHGFGSGSSNKESIVTKMWISACSHVTCAKHLENGAPPFHPEGEPPRAPCPRCLKDRDDASPKELYGIRGLSEGEYDPTIPESWLRCPAMKLDTSVPGMEALRFQYMALDHYSRQVRRHWKSALQKQSTMEAAYSKERKSRRQVQSELLELKNRTESLQKSEARLKKWEDREPVITHCVNQFGPMINEIDMLRGQLRDLGYQVSDHQYTLATDRASQPAHITQDQQALSDSYQRTSLNADRSTAPHELGSSNTRKRKHDSSLNAAFHQTNVPTQKRRGASRDMMPPPLPKFKPPQPMGRGRDNPPAHEPNIPVPPSRRSIQTYEGNQWRSFETRAEADGGFARNQNSPSLRDRPVYHSPVYHARHRAYIHEPQEPEHPFLNNTTHQNQPYDAQTFEQLSIRTPRRANNQDYQQQVYMEAENLPVHFTHAARVAHENSRYGALENEAQFDQHHALSTTSGRHGRYKASSSLRGTPAPAPSVTSPFFKRGPGVEMSSAIQRPVARGDPVGSQYAPSARQPLPSQGVSSYHRGSQPNGPARTLNGLSFIDQPHRQADHQPLYQSPGNHTQVERGYRQDYSNSQTPRGPRGPFQRSDVPRPSAPYQLSKPSSGVYRTQASQVRTNRSPMSVAGVRDQALAGIPGVRGVALQRGHQNFPTQSQRYDTGRNLFSSAGGRRSVRR